MLAGARTSDGSLYVDAGIPATTDPVVAGIAFTNLGAVRVAPVLGEQVVSNGFQLRNNGALCIAYGATPVVWQGGLPFDAAGRLCCQLNQTPATSDPYVGGIRVGPLGGVYTTDTAPPPFNGFSTGFDAGYGA